MLLDRDLWEAWSQHPPRFGNFTFVLLPWHHIVELHGFRRHAPGLNYAPLRDAAELFSKLSSSYPHVVILSQADRRQILVMERRAGGATARQAHTPWSLSVATPLSDALSKVAVRFTTRLESLARLSAGKRPDPHDVPLPLLFRASREVNASSQERIHRIFFRGSCTSKLRNRLARDVLATETLAVDVGRCGQGGKSKYPEYAEHLRSRSSCSRRAGLPATFMLGRPCRPARWPCVCEARMMRGSGWGQARQGRLPARARGERDPPVPRGDRGAAALREFGVALGRRRGRRSTTKLKRCRRGSRRSPHPAAAARTTAWSGRCLPPTVRALVELVLSSLAKAARGGRSIPPPYESGEVTRRRGRPKHAAERDASHCVWCARRSGGRSRGRRQLAAVVPRRRGRKSRRRAPSAPPRDETSQSWR